MVQHSIDRHHPWLNHSNLQQIQGRYSRLLRYHPRSSSDPEKPEKFEAVKSDQFYQWDPSLSLGVGDQVITIELAERTITRTIAPPSPSVQLRWSDRWFSPSFWRSQLIQWIKVWRDRYRQQIWRVCILCSITILTLLLGGTTLLLIHYPDLHPFKALLTTIVLLLGGYGDVFGNLNTLYPLPWGMQFFSLSLTLAGTAFVGVLYALLTERLLTLRFQFFQRRLPLPRRDHVVIIGLGQVGQRVANLLRTFHQPCIAIATTPPESHLWSEIAMVTGEVHDCLGKVNLAEARSVVAMTDSEMENLEVALMAHAANPHTGLVIRTYHRRFRDTVAHLFPHTQVLCASELAAEAFAAAAFGENVLSLFRLGSQTILVTDYTIEAGDTLNGLLLGEVAYGYGVVPIFHERAEYKSAQPMPSDDLRLQVGDRMVVLATIEGLKWIEKGQITPPDRIVQVVKALNADAIFQGANEIACITGCTMMTARTLMGKLPQAIPTPLYPHQAFRLVRRLGKAQVQAQILDPANVLVEH